MIKTPKKASAPPRDRAEKGATRLRALGPRSLAGPSALAAKLGRIKLFLCDVDGVLTDASVYIGGDQEIKRFNIQDGLGLRLLQREGIRVGWISNRPSTATTLRAAELKVDFLYQGQGNKVEAAEEILAQAGLTWEEACFLGDDVVDLGVLKRAGLAVAVANGIVEVKGAADYITRAEGGHGAVREVVDMILKAQNKWDGLLRHYAA